MPFYNRKCINLKNIKFIYFYLINLVNQDLYSKKSKINLIYIDK
jgi:hypothetical protein